MRIRSEVLEQREFGNLLLPSSLQVQSKNEKLLKNAFFSETTLKVTKYLKSERLPYFERIQREDFETLWKNHRFKRISQTSEEPEK